MSLIKLEFDATDANAATAFGEALIKLGSRETELVFGKPELVEGGAEGNALAEAIATGKQIADEAEARTEPKAQVDGAIDEDGFAGPSIDVTANNDPARVDHHGTPYNATYCSTAESPYYASGKRKGQWKKRQKVDDAAYDDWYAASRPAGEPAPAAAAQTAPVDTAAAFGGDAAAGAAEDIPATCGEFMAWLSAQQAAGHLNEHDFPEAHKKLGFEVTDLFPPTAADVVAGHVASLYAELS